MAFTRVVGPGIHTQANIDSHNIHSTGIITATKFDGPFDSINVSGAATFTGSVSIGGTLTYEDVTNVDSIGIVTARSQLNVGSNIKLGNAGVVTATSYRGDGSQLTGIDATSLKDSGGNTKVQAQASGLMVTGITTVSGNLMPGSDNNLNLGSLSQRWANIYVGDMNLSNKGSSNIVDGTWGNFTLQEGESNLFIINNRTGKRYKFDLTEIPLGDD